MNKGLKHERRQRKNSSSSSVLFLHRQNKLTLQYRISNTNGRSKGKKRQNDQRCNMLQRVKLEDEGISRHGRNTRKLSTLNLDNERLRLPLALLINLNKKVFILQRNGVSGQCPAGTHLDCAAGLKCFDTFLLRFYLIFFLILKNFAVLLCSPCTALKD